MFRWKKCFFHRLPSTESPWQKIQNMVIPFGKTSRQVICTRIYTQHIDIHTYSNTFIYCIPMIIPCFFLVFSPKTHLPSWDFLISGCSSCASTCSAWWLACWVCWFCSSATFASKRPWWKKQNPKPWRLCQVGFCKLFVEKNQGDFPWQTGKLLVNTTRLRVGSMGMKKNPRPRANLSYIYDWAGHLRPRGGWLWDDALKIIAGRFLGTPVSLDLPHFRDLLRTCVVVKNPWYLGEIATQKPHLPATPKGLRHLLSELRAPYQLLWSSAFLQIRLAQMLLNQLGNGWESIQDSFMISILGFSAVVLRCHQTWLWNRTKWRFVPGRSAMFQLVTFEDTGG